jgi:hypothetical protein
MRASRASAERKSQHLRSNPHPVETVDQWWKEEGVDRSSKISRTAANDLSQVRQLFVQTLY